jgi:hypothetical protein
LTRELTAPMWAGSNGRGRIRPSMYLIAWRRRSKSTSRNFSWNRPRAPHRRSRCLVAAVAADIADEMARRAGLARYLSSIARAAVSPDHHGAGTARPGAGRPPLRIDPAQANAREAPPPMTPPRIDGCTAQRRQQRWRRPLAAPRGTLVMSAGKDNWGVCVSIPEREDIPWRSFCVGSFGWVPGTFALAQTGPVRHNRQPGFNDVPARLRTRSQLS